MTTMLKGASYQHPTTGVIQGIEVRVSAPDKAVHLKSGDHMMHIPLADFRALVLEAMLDCDLAKDYGADPRTGIVADLASLDLVPGREPGRMRYAVPRDSELGGRLRAGVVGQPPEEATTKALEPAAADDEMSPEDLLEAAGVAFAVSKLLHDVDCNATSDLLLRQGSRIRRRAKHLLAKR